MMNRSVPKAPFARADVIGLGFVGLSIALGLEARGVARKVRGFDPDPDARALARNRGLETEAHWTSGGSELVILAAPPRAVLELVRGIAEARDGALVTDVASVKRAVVSEARAMVERSPGFWFVGSHPLAGSHRPGGAGARADLVVGRAVAVCAVEGVPLEAVAEIEHVWQLLGGVPYRVDAAAHDRAVAATSHLPQVAANALAAVAAPRLAPGTLERSLIASGFLDSTRVGAGEPGLWGEILALNADQVAPLVRSLADEMTGWADLLDSIAASSPAASASLAQRWRTGSDFRRSLGEEA